MAWGIIHLIIIDISTHEICHLDKLNFHLAHNVSLSNKPPPQPKFSGSDQLTNTSLRGRSQNTSKILASTKPLTAKSGKTPRKRPFSRSSRSNMRVDSPEFRNRFLLRLQIPDEPHHFHVKAAITRTSESGAIMASKGVAKRPY
jgi:hypothetical protein